MKTLIAALVTFGLSSVALAADAYKVDPVHSHLIFKAQHFGAGYTYGMIHEPTGTFTVDDEAPRFEIEAKAENLDTHNEKRDGHLKSPDFLNARQYPTLAFKSASSKKTGEGKFEVTGDLTLHGVTRPITVTLTKTGENKDPFGNTRAGYEGTFTIHRSDFEIKAMPGGVGEELTITVALEGVKQ